MSLCPENKFRYRLEELERKAMRLATMRHGHLRRAHEIKEGINRIAQLSKPSKDDKEKKKALKAKYKNEKELAKELKDDIKKVAKKRKSLFGPAKKNPVMLEIAHEIEANLFKEKLYYF